MSAAPRFAEFDRVEKKATLIDGVLYIGNPDRDVVKEFGFIELLDERSDEFVSIPLRSAIHYGSPGFEVGPFSLGEEECSALYSALADHLGSFDLAKAVSA